MKKNEIFCGDWKEAARQLAPQSIDCIVTSPPYYGLRSYLPGKVVLKTNLSNDEISFVLSELKRLGINHI